MGKSIAFKDVNICVVHIFENPLAKPSGKFSNQVGASLAKGWLKSAPFLEGVDLANSDVHFRDGILKCRQLMTWGKGVSKITEKVLTYFMDGLFVL